MNLPLQYRWLVAHGFEGLTPWYVLQDEVRRDALRAECQAETGLDILPFAVRDDTDDVAGFTIIDGVACDAVVCFHLTWSGKRESGQVPLQSHYDDLFQWLTEAVVPLTREWMTEDELEDVLEARGGGLQ